MSQSWMEPLPEELDPRYRPGGGSKPIGTAGTRVHSNIDTYGLAQPKRVKCNTSSGQNPDFTTPPPQFAQQFPLTPSSVSRQAISRPPPIVDSDSDEGYGPVHGIFKSSGAVSLSNRQISSNTLSIPQSSTITEEGNGSGGGNPRKRRFGSPEGPGGDRPLGPVRLECTRHRIDGPSSPKAPDGGEPEDEITLCAHLREEQKQLRVINKHPWQIALCPDTWEGHLAHLNVPKSLFYKRTSDKTVWPRIYERTHGQDFHGAKLFADLYHVQTRIHDIHKEYVEEKKDLNKDHSDKANDARRFRAKYFYAVKKVIDRVIRWAWRDGGAIAHRGGDFPPSVVVFDVMNLNTLEQVEAEIFTKMDKLRTEWQMTMKPMQKKIWPAGEIPQPPVIWGFAVMEHNVVLLSMDASNDAAGVLSEENLNMCTQNQRQWHAALIMVTVCFARDKMMALLRQIGVSNLDEPTRQDDSDPDA